MVYHFTIPNKETNPNSIEFIEIYENEEVFWKHSKDAGIAKAYFNAFQAERRSYRQYSTFGYNKDHYLTESLRACCDAFESTYPMTDAGFVLNRKYIDCLDLQDESKLMIKFNIKVPGACSLLIFSLLHAGGGRVLARPVLFAPLRVVFALCCGCFIDERLCLNRLV